MLFLAALLSSVPQAPVPSIDWDRFEVAELERGMDRPLQIAPLPSGDVLWVELGGGLFAHEAATGKRREVARFDVYADQENGLLGIALDPAFASNQRLYVLRSPPDFSGQVLESWRLDGWQLAGDSRREVLRFEEQRRECCHHAGSMAFGPDGCLYVSTGDNTHPHGDSDGFAPIDERDGREPWNALRGSANTASLTGKVLRIRPLDDGGFAIPPGNLFPADGSAGRPEIYAMGCRNPWRISVDPLTGYLYWGDVGPDAGGDGARGPMGYDEVNQARGPGFFGWPMFIADNRAYADWDFEKKESRGLFDPARPLNRSRLNTGLVELPPAQPAWISYPYGDSQRFTWVNGPGGRTACAGPVVRRDDARDGASAVTRVLDGSLLVYEWSRGKIHALRLDERSEIASAQPFLPSLSVVRPVDIELGADGSLYVLDYGTTWGTNADSRLLHVTYASGNRAPLARASATPVAGALPLSVHLSARGSLDRDGDALAYEWRRVSDGAVLGREPELDCTFEASGAIALELCVTDAAGLSATAQVQVLAGNAPPTLRFVAPTDTFARAGDVLRWRVEIDDAEDALDERTEAGEEQSRRTHVASRFRAAAPGGAEVDAHPGFALVRASDCLNCHAVERRIVGPAYREVAGRLAASDEAVELAIERVRKGSSGAWGTTPMLPHERVSAADARRMVEWIRSLADARANAELQQGRAGELRLAAAADGGGGAWTLCAEYQDGGAPGAQPLSASAELVL
ncbi:MAG: glycosyl hydrolase, partial [Planctomycetota bacterium]